MAWVPSLERKQRERARRSGATSLRLCLIVLLLLASVAAATEDPWKKPRDDAHAMLMGAKKLIEQKRFVEAHPLIEQARRVYPLAPVLHYMAALYKMMDDRPREAAVLAEAVLDKFSTAPPDPAVSLERYLSGPSGARARLVSLQRKLASVQVSGADRVQVDDGPEQPTTRRIYVEPGPHRLRFQGGEVAVTLLAGERATVAAPSQVDREPTRPLPPTSAAGLGLRRAGWALTGVGLAGLLAGGILLGLDGRECDKMPMQIVCPNLPLDTFIPGVVVSVSAGVITVAGVALLGVGYRRRAR